MATYNENLNNTTLSSLQNQEMDGKALRSHLDASAFNLYNAQGESITAKQKLGATEKKAASCAIIKLQATDAGNTASNLLTSSNLATNYTKQSITNSAVGASNTQVASNAIVRLAADIGSIYSIIKAADFESDMNTQAEEVMKLMNDTAHAAEQLSQLAMETSMLTAEVSTSEVSGKAENIIAALNNLTKIVSDDFDKINQSIISGSIQLDTAGTTEQQANGAFNNARSAYTASQSSHALSNNMLNLDLSVSKLTDDSYEVVFNEIVKPFDENIVSDYYIILVKDAKKMVFSIVAAENINFEHRELLIPAGEANAGQIKTIINFNDQKLSDSDGDLIQFGVNYVVCVFAIYADNYKKEINNFDDFLSAPSKMFCLSHQLKAVNSAAIKVAVPKPGYELAFETPDQQNHECAYKCMFLPVSGGNQHQTGNTTGINFSFNIMLAQQVAPGNYTIAAEVKKGITHVPIGVNTTDVFGNLLCDGVEYIPVVLSAPNGSSIDQDKYNSAISDFNTTPSFIYKHLF